MNKYLQALKSAGNSSHPYKQWADLPNFCVLVGLPIAPGSTTSFPRRKAQEIGLEENQTVECEKSDEREFEVSISNDVNCFFLHLLGNRLLESAILTTLLSHYKHYQSTRKW